MGMSRLHREEMGGGGTPHAPLACFEFIYTGLREVGWSGAWWSTRRAPANDSAGVAGLVGPAEQGCQWARTLPTAL